MNPVAYGLPELNLPLMATIDIFQREMTGPRGPQIHGTLRALAQVLGGEQTAPAVEMARRWLDRRAWMPTADAAHEIAARIAPRRMVAPATAVILDRPSLRRLLAAFPTASFVRLTAHPLNHGLLALGSQAGQIALQLSGAIDETVDPPIADPQDLWLTVETTLDEELARLGAKQVVTAKLEDLLADPGEALKGLARKLGLKWNKAAVDAMSHPETSSFAGRGRWGRISTAISSASTTCVTRSTAAPRPRWRFRCRGARTGRRSRRPSPSTRASWGSPERPQASLGSGPFALAETVRSSASRSSVISLTSDISTLMR